MRLWSGDERPALVWLRDQRYYGFSTPAHSPGMWWMPPHTIRCVQRFSPDPCIYYPAGSCSLSSGCPAAGQAEENWWGNAVYVNRGTPGRPGFVAGSRLSFASSLTIRCPPICFSAIRTLPGLPIAHSARIAHSFLSILRSSGVGRRARRLSLTSRGSALSAIHRAYVSRYRPLREQEVAGSIVAPTL